MAIDFDPTKLTDDELLQKMEVIQAKILWADRFSGSDMVINLQRFLDMIESERMDRFARQMFRKQQEVFTSVIESDPDLAEKNPVAALDRKKDGVPVTPVSAHKVNITRTSEPVIEKKENENDD